MIDSILDAFNWMALSVKHVKAESVITCFIKAGFRESDDIHTLDEANENIAVISTLNQQKNSQNVPEDYIYSDGHLSNHNSG